MNLALPEFSADMPASMVGGMVSATILTLVVVPVVYFIWQGMLVARDEAWRVFS